MSRFGILRSMTLATVAAAGLAMGGAATALAQDEEAPAASHPNHIHVGTCAELDPNPIAPLNNIEPRMGEDEDEDDEEAIETVGVLTAAPVHYALSDEVEFTWEDMLAESHALNVHESDENVQNYIACGDIGGVVVDGTLVISLSAQNDSGYSGIAILTEDDDGNVDTEVYLAEPVAGNEPPEAEATPVN